ncbi:MAG: hypothetical protein WCP60_01285 [bacterium]
MQSPWLLLVAFCLVVSAHSQVPKQGTLAADTQIPLIVEGKTVGSMNLKAGSQISIIRILPDGVLISRGDGVPYKVARESISQKSLEDATPLPVATPTPVPASTPTPPRLEISSQFTKSLQDAKERMEAGAKSLLTNAAVQSSIDKTKEAALSEAKKLRGVIDAPTHTATPIKVETNDPILAGYWGGAAKAFLIKSLIQSGTFGNSEEARVAARSQVDQLRLNILELPQELLTHLNGTEIRNTNSLGNLAISIQKEVNHRENPGFSSTDINNLKEALTDAKSCALVEFCKATPPTVIKAFVFSGLLSNYDPASDSFLCRQSGPTGGSTYRRMPTSELALAGTALVIAKASWRQVDQGSSNPTPNASISHPSVPEELPPKDFHYDQTLILPGKFVFLKLPFIKQLPRGICMATASLNVIKYLDPEINLEQTELFKSFNNKYAGATDSELIAGVRAMGFEVEHISERALPPKSIQEKIEASLEDNRPIVAMIPGHALTIIGFNKQKGCIIAWNQTGNRKEENLPPGAYETQQYGFSQYIFLRKTQATASAKEENLLKEILGETPDLQKHCLPKGNSEAILTFYQHAFPQAFKMLAGKNRTIILQRDYGKELLQINQQDFSSTMITYTLLPSGTTNQASSYEISRLLAARNGSYYSISSKEAVK